MEQQLDRLVAALEPAVAAVGLALYDVEVTGSGRARTLRVLVDRDGGVDLEAITEATQAIGPVLDTAREVEAVLPGSYLLEVSSPGLERPLRTPAHFRHAVGSEVSLKSRGADGANVRRRVLLTAADDDAIEIEIEGAHEHVEYADVVQARTVFEWGPAPKPGKTAKKPTVSARG